MRMEEESVCALGTSAKIVNGYSLFWVEERWDLDQIWTCIALDE